MNVRFLILQRATAVVWCRWCWRTSRHLLRHQPWLGAAEIFGTHRARQHAWGSFYALFVVAAARRRYRRRAAAPNGPGSGARLDAPMWGFD
jgi:hypothetical protein